MTDFTGRMVDVDHFRKAVEDSPEGVICLDTETTGLDPERDGIISHTIVDLDGNPLFDSLLHTYRRRIWPDAYRINRISPRDVRDAPSIPQVRDVVESVLSEAELIVGYNHVSFDLPMMEANGFSIPDVPLFDVMVGYEGLRGPGVRHRLVDCAMYYQVGFGRDDHRQHSSKGDALVTMECALRMSGIAGGGE